MLQIYETLYTIEKEEEIETKEHISNMFNIY